MNFYAMLNFFPLEYREVFNPDPVRVGLRAFPAGVGTTVGAVLGNALLTWFKGHNKTILVIGCCMMTAFSGALAAVTPEREGLSIALGTMTGLGVGLVLVPSITVAVTVTPDHTIATCVALSLSVRAIGGAIGSAVYYNVYLNKVQTYIPQYVAEYVIKAGLPPGNVKGFIETFLADPTKTEGIPGVTEKVIEAATIGTRWAYGKSLEYVWLSSIAFGGCAMLLCLAVEDISKYMTSRVAARLT
ncbi:hypothetical protein BDV59DRAFT_204963 [Aspergillus ambiguus]|uniref:uncharacterized protein n=1 Tax=Aspergillus ambiguus TaxID=176160 RepID=UPI003CCD90FC